MLDTDIKCRIHTARDILVGNVPDPKSQVEVITNAPVYKCLNEWTRTSWNSAARGSDCALMRGSNPDR
jgi:hypothetical protein